MKKFIAIFTLICTCQFAWSQKVVISKEDSRLKIPNKAIDSITFSKYNTYIYMNTIEGIVINGVKYKFESGNVVTQTKCICDNLVTPTTGQSSSYMRGLFSMIPKGAKVTNFSFMPRNASGDDVCTLWELSDDNMKLTKVSQFTVTSTSSSAQHITQLEKTYNADTFISFHHDSNSPNYSTIGMVSSGVSNDFSTPLTAVVNDEIPIALDTNFTGDQYSLCLKVEYEIAVESGHEFLTVGEGECFTDPTKACYAACSGDTIRIKSGVYKSQIQAFGKELHLVGEDRDSCVLYDDSSDYSTPPIEMNIGSISNLTIKETHANPTVTESDKTSLNYDRYRMAYCVHADSQVNANGKCLVIDNCIMENTYRPCLGAGVRSGHGICVYNTIMKSGLGYTNTISGQNGLRGALYFHSDASAAQPAYFKSVNSIYRCEDTLVATMNVYGNNVINLTFIGNTLYSDINGVSAASISSNSTIGSSQLVIDAISNGNNNTMFNH